MALRVVDWLRRLRRHKLIQLTVFLIVLVFVRTASFSALEIAQPPPPADGIYVPPMGLFFNVAIGQTPNPRDTHGLDVFLTTLLSYSRIPFESAHFFISLQDPAWADAVNRTIRAHFARSLRTLRFEHLSWQEDWRAAAAAAFGDRSDDYPVFFATNDDQPFVDERLDVLAEGVRHVASNATHRYRSLAIARWPEALVTAAERGAVLSPSQRLVVSDDYCQVDGTGVVNLATLRLMLSGYEWGEPRALLDGAVPGGFRANRSFQFIVPLRELTRPFHAYATYPGIAAKYIPPLVCPPEANQWPTDTNALTHRMIPPINKAALWRPGRDMAVPVEWVNAMLRLARNFTGRPFDTLRGLVSCLRLPTAQ